MQTLIDKIIVCGVFKGVLHDQTFKDVEVKINFVN